jgi:hypothetical protein
MKMLICFIYYIEVMTIFGFCPGISRVTGIIPL